MKDAAIPGPEWLPGLPPDFEAETRLDGHTAAGATFWVRQLDEGAAVGVAEAVRGAALAARRTHRVADVVVAVGRAARRLADPEDPLGRAAIEAVRASSGCSRSAAQTILSENASGWTGAELSSLIRSELGELALLDEARPDPSLAGRRRRAAGPPVLHLVLAGNVPGVAVTAVIRALVVRSGVLCKLPASEPWLVGLFARALHEEEPALAATIAATWWPVEQPGPVGMAWTKRAGKVIVYGGAAAVRELRSRTPATIPILEYGPRTGVAILGAEATDTELAGLARDTCAYDQAGCVSPRLVYVLSSSPGISSPQKDRDAVALVQRLAQSLSDEVDRLRELYIADAEAVSIRAARAKLQFDTEEGSRALGPDDLGWTLLYRPELGAYSEPLPRVLWVYRAASVEELRGLRSVLEGRVQALGIAGVADDVRRRSEELAVELGVSRVTPLGAMAWPPADWRHDGRMQLMPLLRWTDFEDDEDWTRISK